MGGAGPYFGKAPCLGPFSWHKGPSLWVSREKLFLIEDLHMAFSFDAIILTQLEKADILFLHSKISLGFAQEKGLYVEFLFFLPLCFPPPFFFP